MTTAAPPPAKYRRGQQVGGYRIQHAHHTASGWRYGALTYPGIRWPGVPAVSERCESVTISESTLDGYAATLPVSARATRESETAT